MTQLPSSTFNNLIEGYFNACADGDITVVRSILDGWKNSKSTEFVQGFQKDGWLTACIDNQHSSIDFFLFDKDYGYHDNPDMLYTVLRECIDQKCSAPIAYILSTVYPPDTETSVFSSFSLCFKLFEHILSTPLQNNIDELDTIVAFVENKFPTLEPKFSILEETNYNIFDRAWQYRNTAVMSYLIEHYALTGKEEGLQAVLKKYESDEFDGQAHILSLLQINLDKQLLDGAIPQYPTNNIKNRATNKI